MLTVFEEISAYQPKDQIIPTSDVCEIRALRDKKKISDEEYCKFWRRPDNEDWLNKKYEIELYNKNCFERLYELLNKHNDKTSAENKAITVKLVQFNKKIQSYSDRPVRSLMIDFSLFNVPDEQKTNAGWDE